MKKILGISIVAVLAVTPMMASATVEAGQVELIPVNQQTQQITPTNNVASTSYVQGAYNVLGTALNAIDDRVDNLETTVGDANGGLVKKVADLESSTENVGTMADDISDLKTAVGDSNSGLTKKVADLETTVGDSNSGLVKAVADNTSDITKITNGTTVVAEAAKATKDGSGNVISTTYATKDDLSGEVTKVTNGTTIAGKATADASGNVITTTYATKDELAGKRVTVHTTWGAETTDVANVIVTPAQG